MTRKSSLLGLEDIERSGYRPTMPPPDLEVGRRFDYHCLHVPTGERFRRSVDRPDELLFLRSLDGWNRLGGGVWVYWSA